MATIYKGNTPLIGGGYGAVEKAKSATAATTATTASNSNALGGVGLSRILEKKYTVRNQLNTPGWYRVAQCIGTNNVSGKGGLLIIEREYAYQYSECYVFAISCGYNNAFDITQLTGVRNTNTGNKIPKIRLVMKNDSKAQIDIYYDTYDNNAITVTAIGGLTVVSPFVASTIDNGWTACAEFTTAVGFKALRTN